MTTLEPSNTTDASMKIFTSDKKINLLILVCCSAYLILMAVIVWDTWANITDRFWIPLGLQIVPLLLILPGLVQRYYRSYSWLCFISLIYFTSFVVQVFSSNQQWHDWIGLTASVLIFISGMYASRWLQRYFLTIQNDLKVQSDNTN